jgi:hypothetical protein
MFCCLYVDRVSPHLLGFLFVILSLVPTQMYKQKAMVLSDMDATDFELEQKALANSMESYRHFEHGRKQRASGSSPVGRRWRSSPPPPAPSNDPPYLSSPFASIPPAAAAAATAASLPDTAMRSAAASRAASSGLTEDEEYPQTVQELVMNGFELSKVVRAYELIGDNFDNMLSFLLSPSEES